MFSLEAMIRYSQWSVAMTVHKIAKGEIEMGNKWFRKGSIEEDQMVVEANNLILETLADSDMVNQIETMTGKNLRDQISVEEAIELEEERKLRGWGVRRN